MSILSSRFDLYHGYAGCNTSNTTNNACEGGGILILVYGVLCAASQNCMGSPGKEATTDGKSWKANENLAHCSCFWVLVESVCVYLQGCYDVRPRMWVVRMGLFSFSFFFLMCPPVLVMGVYRMADTQLITLSVLHV